MSTMTANGVAKAPLSVPAAVSTSGTLWETLISDNFAAHLKQLAQEKAQDYRTNSPFPNIYFDDFLPREVAEQAVRDFPAKKQLRWNEFSNENEAKLAFDRVERLPESLRDILYFFNSRPMLGFLEELTGIQGLIPDPYFVGGGLHQILPGGFLEVHADFNRHTKLQLDRRLNVLLYLNEDWKEEYGGHFELWDTEMKGAVRKILPLFNRMAMFSTTSNSYHGHPNPLTCPPDRSRRSIAVYYYTNGRPEEEVTDGHDTLFQARDGVVKPRPSKLKGIVRSIVPPIIMDAVTRK